MTAGEVVALARRACSQAELELTAARLARDDARLKAATVHWQHTRSDLQRVLAAVQQ